MNACFTENYYSVKVIAIYNVNNCLLSLKQPYCLMQSCMCTLCYIHLCILQSLYNVEKRQISGLWK